MVRAREAILARGGAARANVFTRIALALFGQLPWRAVPYIPVEIMLLPKWFPFHLDKVSYWSRTVMVPLFILCTRKPLRAEPARRRHPRAVHDAAGGGAPLLPLPRQRQCPRPHLPGSSTAWRAGIDPLIPRAMRERAMRRAEAWMLERLNGEDGLGAIFPAMVNALEVMVLLGYPADDPRRVTAKRAIEKLLVDRGDQRLLPALRLAGVGHRAGRARHAGGGRHARRRRPPSAALDWLHARAAAATSRATGSAQRPHLPRRRLGVSVRATSYYPDLDDTAVVAWAMHQARLTASATRTRSSARSTGWSGMQSQNGGFAAFDADNTHYYLNNIPFADHGALLDPPTSDVTARVVTVLARCRPAAGPRRARARHRVPARASRKPTAPGSAAGAPTTSTAPGRC